MKNNSLPQKRKRLTDKQLLLQDPKAYEERIKRQKEWKQRKLEKYAWDYEDWKAGKFIPTPARLKSMKKAGYAFPEFVTVEHGSL